MSGTDERDCRSCHSDARTATIVVVGGGCYGSVLRAPAQRAARGRRAVGDANRRRRSRRRSARWRATSRCTRPKDRCRSRLVDRRVERVLRRRISIARRTKRSVARRRDRAVAADAASDGRVARVARARAICRSASVDTRPVERPPDSAMGARRRRRHALRELRDVDVSRELRRAAHLSAYARHAHLEPAGAHRRARADRDRSRAGRSSRRRCSAGIARTASGCSTPREVVEADARIGAAGDAGAAEVIIGTVSHCHGALTRLVIGRRSTPVPTSRRFDDIGTWASLVELAS